MGSSEKGSYCLGYYIRVPYFGKLPYFLPWSERQHQDVTAVVLGLWRTIIVNSLARGAHYQYCTCVACPNCGRVPCASGRSKLWALGHIVEASDTPPAENSKEANRNHGTLFSRRKPHQSRVIQSPDAEWASRAFYYSGCQPKPGAH